MKVTGTCDGLPCFGGIGGNVPVSQDNQSLFCKVCGTGPEYSSAPNPESLADNGKLAEKAVDYT